MNNVLVFIFGLFLVLHGLVHLLYCGQSARLFELRPGLVWPDGAWPFAKRLGDEATRTLASISTIGAAIGFAAGGIGLLVGQNWWRTVVIAAAAFSALLYIFFWDGKVRRLDDKGGIGLLINLGILAALLALRWPQLEV